MNIDIEITRVMYDFYETDDDVLLLFPNRPCFGCGRKFELHDMVSVAFTDRGNKLFHTSCLQARMEAGNGRLR